VEVRGAMDVRLLAFGIIVVLAITVLFFSQRAMYREKERAFASRHDIGPDEFYDSFYRESGLPRQGVVELLREVSTETGIPASKLRPQDRFGRELAPVRGWEFDDGIGILEWNVQRRAKRICRPIDLKQVRTLDDYIRVMLSPGE
jgi:hypothetical protein